MRRNKGFIAIECVVSLSILTISVYLVSTALQNSYRQVANNEKNRTMLNLAKSHLENQKYKIKNTESEVIEKKALDIQSKGIEEYNVSSTVIPNDNFYKNYKVSVKVTGDKRTMELVSYVTKQ
ncbi:type II secretion system protein [Metaclostridioides mangenotii]|uniref:type II secretion system protein n=1 Tax=Metaclostridioides mangenotii TaxID=1540 RepID=UPI0028E82279|nr:type II secretion system protein [Clostridioides mangenotii]